MSFCAFAQLVTTIIFFSGQDKSGVMWDNARPKFNTENTDLSLNSAKEN